MALFGGSYGPEYSRAVVTGLLHSSSGQDHQQAPNSPTTIDTSYSHSHESQHAFSTMKRWNKTNPFFLKLFLSSVPLTCKKSKQFRVNASPHVYCDFSWAFLFQTQHCDCRWLCLHYFSIAVMKTTWPAQLIEGRVYLKLRVPER